MEKPQIFSADLGTPNNETAFCFVASDVCLHTLAAFCDTGVACRWRLLLPFFRREQVFSPSERKEVMLMNLHDGLVAIVLALNLLLEYIAQHRKR